MKHVLLEKKIVKVVSKSTRSIVLRGEAGLRGALRGGDRTRKFFPSCGTGWGWGKIKSCGTRPKTPSFCPTSPHCHPYPGEF